MIAGPSAADLLQVRVRRPHDRPVRGDAVRPASIPQLVPLHALGLMGGLSVVIVAVLLGTLFGPAPDAGQGEVNAKGGDGAVSGVSDG